MDSIKLKDVSFEEGKFFKKSNELINADSNATALSELLFAVGMQVVFVDEDNRVVSTIYKEELRRLYGPDYEKLYECLENYLYKSNDGETIYDWTIILEDHEGNKTNVNVVEDAELKEETVVLTYSPILTDKLVNLEGDYTLLSLKDTLLSLIEEGR